MAHWLLWDPYLSTWLYDHTIVGTDVHLIKQWLSWYSQTDKSISQAIHNNQFMIPPARKSPPVGASLLRSALQATYTAVGNAAEIRIWASHSSCKQATTQTMTTPDNLDHETFEVQRITYTHSLKQLSVLSATQMPCPVSVLSGWGKQMPHILLGTGRIDNWNGLAVLPPDTLDL